jgi:hypothetical protein
MESSADAATPGGDCVPIGQNPGIGGVITAPAGIGQSVAFTTCGEASGASLSFSGGSGGTWQSDTLDSTSSAIFALHVVDDFSGPNIINDVTAGIWVDNGHSSLNKCQYVSSSESQNNTVVYSYITCVNYNTSIPTTGTIKLAAHTSTNQWSADFGGSVPTAYVLNDMSFGNVIYAGVSQQCQCAFSPVRDSTANSPSMYVSDLQFQDSGGAWHPWGTYSHCYLKKYGSPYLSSFGNKNFVVSFKSQLSQGLGDYSGCDGSVASMPRSGSW